MNNGNKELFNKVAGHKKLGLAVNKLMNSREVTALRLAEVNGDTLEILRFDSPDVIFKILVNLKDTGIEYTWADFEDYVMLCYPDDYEAACDLSLSDEKTEKYITEDLRMLFKRTAAS